MSELKFLDLLWFLQGVKISTCEFKGKMNPRASLDLACSYRYHFALMLLSIKKHATVIKKLVLMTVEKSCQFWSRIK